MCNGHRKGHRWGLFGEPKQRGVSVFGDEGRAEQIPAYRMARSQERAPCPNRRATRERHLKVAGPEPERATGAALKPAGVLSWGSTLPPIDSKQGPRGLGMISGIQPVVFSTVSCRKRMSMVERHLVSIPQPSPGYIPSPCSITG